MKKAAAPPPPRPFNGAGSGSSSVSAEDSDSLSGESLEGRMELTVHLPNNKIERMSVERRTPMMDLLVQVTKANNLSPGGYVLKLTSDNNRNPSPYKPSTAVGSLSCSMVYVIPKSSGRESTILRKESKIGNSQPFEKTFRLRIHLPRNQLHVLRVSPNTPLDDVFRAICMDRELTPSKYELRHPIHREERLDPQRCLTDYGLSEVAVVAVKEPSSGLCRSSSDIMALQQEEERKKRGFFGFMFKKTSKSSIGDTSSDGHSSRGVSPARSDENQCISLPPTTVEITSQRRYPKKRIAPTPPSLKPPAPKPPVPQPVTPVNENGDASTSITHSRNSSDSSGYHESSILSDSQEPGNVLDHSNSARPQRPHSVQSEYSTFSNKGSNLTTVNSNSSLSVLSSGPKKRKAPVPPNAVASLVSAPLAIQSSPSPSPLLNNSSTHYSPASVLPSEDDLGIVANSESLKISNAHEERQVNGNGHSRNSSISSGASSSGEEIKQIVPATPPHPVPRQSKTPQSLVNVIEENGLQHSDSDTEKHVDVEDTSEVNNISSRKSSTNSMICESTELNHVSVKQNIISAIDAKNDTLLEKSNAIDSHETNRRLSNNSSCSSVSKNDSFIDNPETLFIQKLDTEELPTLTNGESEKYEVEDLDSSSTNEVSVQTNFDFENIPPPLEELYADDKNSADFSRSSSFDAVKENEQLINEQPIKESSIDDEEILVEMDAVATLNSVVEEPDSFVKQPGFERSESIKSNDSWKPQQIEDNHEGNIDAVIEKVFASVNETVEQLRLDEDNSLTEVDNWEYTVPQVPPPPQFDNNYVTELDQEIQPDHEIVSDILCEAPLEFQNNFHEKETTVETLSEVSEIVDVQVVNDNDLPMIENNPILEAELNAEIIKNEEQDTVTEITPVVEEKPIVRTIYRRPVVKFSINTYKAREEEEVKYQSKLFKTESFSNRTIDTETESEFKIPKYDSSSLPRQTTFKEKPKVESISGQSKAITNAIATSTPLEIKLVEKEVEIREKGSSENGPLRRAKSEMQLDTACINTSANNTKDQVIEQEKLQSEYQKLHEQFMQWQQQLLQNQTLLQQQQISPESTTEALQRLQLLQQQFMSLQSLPESLKQNDAPKTESLDQSKSDISPPSSKSSSNTNSLERQLPRIGPKPWRPASVSITAWNPNRLNNNNNSNGTITDFDKANNNSKTYIGNSNGNLVKEKVTNNAIIINEKPTLVVNKNPTQPFLKWPVVKGFVLDPQPKSKVVLNSNSERTVSSPPYKNKPIQSLGTVEVKIESAKNVGKPAIATIEIEDKNTIKNYVNGFSNKSQNAEAGKKFTTVVNLAKQQQQAAPIIVPPPPPPPAPIAPKAAEKSFKSQRSVSSNSSEEGRDLLMVAIKGFGGRSGLRKISSSDASWQQRYGNVNQ